MSKSTLSSLLDALPDAVIVGQVQTAGVRGFISDDGKVVSEPMWLVCSQQRAWLAAVHGGELRAVASPNARVVRGWVTDTVEVGPWSAPLRRGTRAAAESLLTKWRALTPSGEAVPPPRPQPPDTPGKEPRGTELPPALIRHVPVPPPDDAAGTAWLLAAPTRSDQPFDRPDGTVATATVTVAVSDRHQVLFSEGPDHTWHTPVRHLVYRLRTSGVEVTADERILHGPRRADRELLLAWKLSALRRPERWAFLATTRLEQGNARDAIRLLSEALDRGLATAWPEVARIFLALGDPDRALMAAFRALEVTPALDTDAAAQACHPAVDRERLKDANVDRPFAWALWRSAYEGLDRVPVPDGIPWPPSSAEGLWAAALGAHGRSSEALHLADDDALDQLEARAALLTADHHPNAAEAWFRAAERAREEGRDHASGLLDRALALEQRPAWHTLRAAWAWAEADRDVAVVHWESAMDEGLAPDGHPPLPADAERALARLAHEEHPAHAAAAWARIIALDPDDPSGWAEAVARAPSPEVAADRQQAWCAHADTLEEPPEPRFPRWVEAAELQATAGRRDVALNNLRTALEQDFLRGDAYRAAIGVADRCELPAPVPWWRHVAALLDGVDAEGAPQPPDAELNAGELDALHPAGTGWLDRVRHQLDGEDPPTHAQLTRGLARLDREARPVLAAHVDRIASALGLPAPEVYVFRGDGAHGCSGWPLDVPVVLLGHDHLVPDGPRLLPPEGLAFLVAVELVHLAAGHPVLAFDADFVGTSRSLYRAFGSYASTAETVVDVVTLIPGIDQFAKLQTLFSLSRKVFATRSTVDKVGSVTDPVLRRLGLASDPDEEVPDTGLSRAGLEGAALQFRLQADRAALLLTGDLRAAVDAIFASAPDPAGRCTPGALAERMGTVDEPLRLSGLLQFAASIPSVPAEPSGESEPDQ